MGDPLRDTSKTFIFMSRCNCCLFLIYIAGILTRIMLTLQKQNLYYHTCSWNMYCGPACSIFHHDSVLSVLVVALKSFFSSNKCNNAQSNNSIKFLKAGGKSSKYTKKLHPGLLYLTADWNLLSNLDDKEVSDLLLL